MSQRNVDLFRQSVAAANAREVPEEILAADFRTENVFGDAADHRSRYEVVVARFSYGLGNGETKPVKPPVGVGCTEPVAG
jgi:hypothetical protein